MADNLKKIHSITQLNNSIFKEVKFNIPVIEGFKLDTSLVERIEELQSINKILFTDNSIKKSLSFINTFTEEFKLDTSLIQEYLDFINNAVINEKNQDNSRDDSEQTKSEIISFLKNNFPDLNNLLTLMEKEEKNYPLIILQIVLIIIFVIPSTKDYIDIFSQKDGYIINRENVRIRKTPDASRTDNVIVTLHKNVYVEKIEKEDGWMKVKYNLIDGKEDEGWIYQTMLSKAND